MTDASRKIVCLIAFWAVEAVAMDGDDSAMDFLLAQSGNRIVVSSAMTARSLLSLLRTSR